MSGWVGRTVSKVEIQKVLSRGGMAVVYLGRHTTLDRPVAVKVLFSHLNEDPDLQERFKREARSVAALRHPNIVQVYDFDVADDLPYIVMELLQGIPLSDYLAGLRREGRTMTLATVGRLATGIAAALDYAHARGIVHRDIKPSNVYLRRETPAAKTPGINQDDSSPAFVTPGEPLPEDVEPVLLDFGVMSIAEGDSAKTATGTVIGTPTYMSPEQADGQHVDARSDVYSLGVMLYEMISGKPPFDPTTLTPTSLLVKHISATPPHLPNANPNVRAVLERALAKNREERYQHAGELAADLVKAIAQGEETDLASMPTHVSRPAGEQTAGVPPTGKADLRPSSFVSASNSEAQPRISAAPVPIPDMGAALPGSTSSDQATQLRRNEGLPPQAGPPPPATASATIPVGPPSGAAARKNSSIPLFLMIGLAAVALVILVLVFGKFGSNSSSNNNNSTSSNAGTGGAGTTVSVSNPTTINIDMSGFKFIPADITITAGSTVIWTNKDAVKHTVTEDSGVFDSGTMDKGATFSRKFDTPGSISYYCKFHGSPGQGMFGHITVTAAQSQSAQASPSAAGTTVAVAAAPTNTAAPTNNPTTIPAQSTAVLGSVRFTDSLSQTDQLILSVSKMPAKPETKAFYGWLVNSANGKSVSLGRLTPDANGAVNLTYGDPANANLLASYDSVLITYEDLESVPSAPSTDVALSGKLPPQALVHIRHLLVSFPATPNKIGLEVGLRSQVELVRQHAQFMSDAQSSGDLATVKLHAEHLVNIIEGAKGTDYGDLNKDGKITNPGDGYGLLPNGDQLGYLQGSKDHAALAAGAPDATADIKLHAGHVGITVDNVTGWVATIRDTAIQVAQSPNLKATDPLVRRIVALSGQALNGVDLNGDGQILPIPGSGGAITSYQHAQLMAGIVLQAK